MKTLNFTHTAILLSFLSFSSFSNAAVNIPVDSKQHCFDTTLASGNVTKFQLASGRYVASLVSNQMSCSNGDLKNGCLINTVTISGGFGNSRWGVSIKDPIVLDIPSNASFVAFVTDDFCSDNTGNASIRFQKAN